MPTLDQFEQKLTDSGLMSVTDLQEFRDRLPPQDQPQVANDLSRSLVETKVLTEYQASVLASDQPQPLVVGDYVVLDKVGAGGMGVVFRAQHRRMKRTVALKMLPAEFSKDQSAIRRFEREVEVAAKLNHPNIVAALDAREQAGNHYLIMEYVEGRALSTVLDEDGVLPIATAVDYIIQAATGLARAHELGVVHRDVKPSNLMIGSDGVIKILDMGLARVDLPVADGFAQTQTNLTSVGVIMGTMNYVSPEQAMDSRRVDHRTDIYSLGCTLYCLLTGRTVYSGETPMELLIAHREREIPSIRELRPEASQNLDAVFHKMVAKRPEDRFSSMAEVLEALHACSDQTAGALPNVQPTASIGDWLGNSHPPAGIPYAEPDIPEAEMVGRPRDFLSSLLSVVTDSLTSQAKASARSIVSPPVGLVHRGKRFAAVNIGRIAGITLGVIAGVNLGTPMGGLAIVAGILVYLWLGMHWGAAYGWVFAEHNGWAGPLPSNLGGDLFRPLNLKTHAIAAIIGAAIGGWFVGTLAGTFLGLTVLMLLQKLRGAVN